MESIHETRHVIDLHKIFILNISKAIMIYSYSSSFLREGGIYNLNIASLNNYDKNKHITEVDFINHNV